MCATKANELNTSTYNRKQQQSITTINYIKTWGISLRHTNNNQNNKKRRYQI